MEKINKENNNLMNAREVSKYLRIPLGTVYRLTYIGKIKAVKIGKHWRYARNDIERYLAYGTEFSKEPERRCPSTPMESEDSYGVLRTQPLSEVRPHSERRVYPRINCSLPCNINVSIPFEKELSVQGRILNISTGGVFIKNHTEDDVFGRINPDDPLVFEFELDDKDMKDNRVSVRGRVLRMQENGIGVKFRKVSSEIKEKINDYIG